MQNKKTLGILTVVLVLGMALVIIQLQFKVIDLGSIIDPINLPAIEQNPTPNAVDAITAELGSIANPLSPLSNSAIATEQPTFNWEGVETAQSYVINIWREEPDLFEIDISYLPPASGCEDNICTYTSPFFLEVGKTYFWTVTSLLENNGESTSTTQTFTIKQYAQQIPLAVYPKNGKVITVGTTILKWRPVEPTRYYLIELFRPDGNQTDTIKVSSSLCTTPTSCTYKLSYHLEQAYGTYQWRVQAIHETPALVSQWSEYATFQYSRLEQLAPLSPAHNSATTNNKPVFSWAESTETVFKYDLQIFKNSGELVDQVSLTPETICNADGCSWQSRISLPKGKYKWRVLAKSYPNLSFWTDIWFFTVQ